MLQKSYGFSLIELMVAITVLAVLLGVGLPSFNNVIQNSRSTALANEIVTSLNLARSEAVKRTQSIMVCASTDQATCNGSWDGSNGWIVLPVATGASVLRVWDAPPSSAVITGDDIDIVFNALGELDVAAGSVTLCSRFSGFTGDQARAININASGRINVRRITETQLTSTCP